MSLLMDALRKAEEAKKKAELKGKSDPAPETSAQDEAANGLDIEIEFDAPEESPALIDDLAADSLDAADHDTPPIASTESIANAPENSSHKLTGEPDIEADVQAGDTAGPVVTPPQQDDSHSVNYTPQLLDTADDSPATAPEPEPDTAPATESASAASAPVEKAQQPLSLAASFQTQTRPEVFEPAIDQPDIEMEEQDRRSAQSVFTAKRRTSPLRKNLQLTAMSVAALLIVGFGIYFYINLRTSSGISVPSTAFDAQQPQQNVADTQAQAAGVESEQTAASDVAVDTTTNDLTTNQTLTTTDNPVVSNPVIDIAASGDDVNPLVSSSGQPAVSDTATPALPSASEPVQAPADDSVTSVPAVAAPASQASPTLAVSPASTARNAETNQPGATATAAAPSPVSVQTEATEPQTLVSFTRSVTPPPRNTVVDDAYAAYQDGNLVAAERLYRQALASEPLNRNALLGLAAIAASRQDTVAALELYSRLLARNPNDPVARAGLLDIMPRGNLREQETALKRLQADNPDIAPLAYAVGNFMASQQRWSEAQQAYFSALQLAKNDARGNPVNPDYAFNLAVSLEHLGQGRPASMYYQEAITLAEVHPAGFDLAVARQRLGSMESSRNEQ